VVLSSTILPDGLLKIVFSVVEGGVYQLQEQEGLNQKDWRTLETSFTALTTKKTYTLPMNNPSQRGFFRLVRQ
jgi:hypothetical protein